MDAPAGLVPQGSRAYLSSLRRSGLVRIPPPEQIETRHQVKCQVCRLEIEEQAELEAGYLSWTPVAELARTHRVKESWIRRHAALYGQTVLRLGRIGEACTMLVEAGIRAAQDCKDPRIALEAVALLKGLEPEPEPGQASTPAGQPGSWEASIRIKGHAGQALPVEAEVIP